MKHKRKSARSSAKPPTGKSHRVPEPQREERIALVAQLLAQWWSRARIVSHLAKPGEHGAGIPSRTIDGYIAEVRRRWKERQEERVEDARERARERVGRIARKALEGKDLGSALQAERLIADFEGTRRPERHEHTGAEGGPLQVRTETVTIELDEGGKRGE